MYDYKVLTFKKIPDMQSELSKLAKDGWRVISIVPWKDFSFPNLVVTLEKTL